jgi:hypothetical protein
MAHDIKESDWKLFRSLRAIALERFCRRVLDDIASIASDTGKSAHQRYLEIYRLVRERDKELAFAFNDVRRSTAIMQLGVIASHDFLTAEELAQFSPDVRGALEMFRAAGV